MSAEAVYERGWHECNACGYRRPPGKLDAAGVCNDDWHAGQDAVLRSEAPALRHAKKKAKREGSR